MAPRSGYEISDLTDLCLSLDPCVCDLCGHGHHDTCTGQYVLYTDEITSCRCPACHPLRTPCSACGASYGDECLPGCAGEPEPVGAAHVGSRLLTHVLADAGLTNYRRP